MVKPDVIFKNKVKTTHIDTLIGRYSKVIGDVCYGKGLHIAGTVAGNVIAENEDTGGVIISETGVVEGEIRGSSVVINGTVNGNVYAAGTVELAASAKVNGDVYYDLLEMDAGAEVNGNLLHKQLNNT